MEEKVLQVLKKHQLRVTSIRKDLLGLFMGAEVALSNQDIEEKMPDIDRVTLYRTLKSFQEKGIIHKALDGTSIPKYASCPPECTVHSHHDEHIHFHCADCSNTFCVDEIKVPEINMPSGFRANQVNVVVEGICENCG